MEHLELRPIASEEFPAAYERMTHCLGQDVVDEDRRMYARVFRPDSSLGVFDGGRIVGTTAWARRELAVPGAVVPVVVGFLASVAPTHRRQGLLTAMKQRQLQWLFERGDEVYASRPSEAPIYGRYGYGPATREAVLTGDTARMRVPPELAAGYRVVEAEAADARQAMVALYERFWPMRPGWLSRPGGWWDLRFYDPPHRRDGATAHRVVLCEDSSGGRCGYVVYVIRYSWDTVPRSEVEVIEIAAGSVGAYAALWRYILGLDLVRSVRCRIAAADDPLELMLTDARAVGLSVRDGLWIQLVDVGRALAGRRYRGEVDIVLEVDDEFCSWRAGRWRLSTGAEGAVCARTSVEADIRLSAGDLAAVYLGGTSLHRLAAAGRVAEQRRGALDAAAWAFTVDPPPFCPETF